MSQRATANFEITGWEQTAYGDEGGPELARATVRKTFRGDLEGTSTAELLMCGSNAEGAGYLAQEVVTGTLAGRAGTFVVQHGGIRGGGTQRAFGNVVPGSATGQLRGLTGTVEYSHDERGAVLRMEYEFEIGGVAGGGTGG